MDTERVIGDIDPMIYGNFIEHLGRCIDGGIFEEGHKLSDNRGFRKDVFEAATKLNVTQLRWPGGNFSSNYNWKDGIGPRDRLLLVTRLQDRGRHQQRDREQQRKGAKPPHQ